MIKADRFEFNLPRAHKSSEQTRIALSLPDDDSELSIDITFPRDEDGPRSLFTTVRGARAFGLALLTLADEVEK